MKNLTATLALLSALFLSACNTPDKEIFSRTMQIESVPSGASIIIDGLKIGKTPIGIGVETTENGYFVRRTSITVIPPADNLNTQVKTFPAYSPNNPEASSVPATITFNMDKDPNDPQSVVLEGESSF